MIPIFLVLALAFLFQTADAFQVSSSYIGARHRGGRSAGLLALSMTTSKDEWTPRKIVICGGGIGGLSSAFDARHLLRSIDDITVVSDRESFEFTPSNPWVGVGKRRPEDIRLPLKTILPRHKINFVNGKVMHLNPTKQQLKIEDGTLVDYDFLIIATGPRLAFDEVPGAGPKKGYSHSICTTNHAAEAAKGFEKLVADPGPVVIGSVQGASCFGPAYEYALLVQHELHRRGGDALNKKCPITFVTPEPYVGHIGLGGAGDSEKILLHLLKERNIEWITNCRVSHVGPESVTVIYEEDTGDGHFKAVKKILPSKFTMLIPAFRGIKVWSSVSGLTDKNDLILVDEHQQSKTYPNIFGVGVCTSIPPVDKTLVATGPPKTGYMIESMGTAAVKNIRLIIDHEERLKQEATGEKGGKAEIHNKSLMNGLCITDFGDDGAIFLTMPQMPPRRMDVTITGKIATLAKIAFEKYFLHKVESGDTDPYYEKYMLKLVGVERTEWE